MLIDHIEGTEEDDYFNAYDEANFDDKEVELDPEELAEVASVLSNEVAHMPHVQPPSPLAWTEQFQIYIDFPPPWQSGTQISAHSQQRTAQIDILTMSQTSQKDKNKWPTHSMNS